MKFFAAVLSVLVMGSFMSSAALAQDDTPWGQPPTDAPAEEPEVEEPAAPAAGGLTEEELAARRLKGQLNKQLYTVEQEVSGLKERGFRSKATLQLIRELVIEGATIGSRVSLWHVNKLSGAYSIESVQYFLDGNAIFSRTDTSGGLDSLKETEIHAQTLPPGMHTLQVNMVLRGNGHGIFSYLRAYSFKVQSSYTFTVEDGQLTVVRINMDEKGGPFASFVDRPNVAYDEDMEALRGG